MAALLEIAKAFRKMTDGMKYFLGAVGITTLFLGAIGVMNVMLVAVRERTREIGVRKAVGAPARSILMQFFLETMIIVFLSGGGGLLFAFGFFTARLPGINFWMQVGYLTISAFVGLNPQEPVCTDLPISDAAETSR